MGGKGGEGRGREERKGEGRERAMSPPTIWTKFTPITVQSCGNEACHFLSKQ